MRGREKQVAPKGTKSIQLVATSAKERLKAISMGPRPEGFKIKKYLNVSCRTDHQNTEYIRTSKLSTFLIIID